MNRRQLWPAVIGVIGILFGLFICGCGLMQSFAVLLSSEPFVVTKTITIPRDRGWMVAALGIGCYSIPALLCCGIGISVWSIYGHQRMEGNRRVKLIAALLALAVVVSSIWAIVA